jgi:chromosome partitioning protein
MKIVFGNQKGGVGKSTLCVMLANYLTFKKKKKVLVLDMDFQKSIHQMRESDALAKGKMPYKIYPIETADYPKYASEINNVDDIILIDLPGRLDDKTLFPILLEADYIITPFDYERQTFASTLTFAQFIRYIDKNKKVFFVPNKFKTNINYELKDSITEQLGEYGTITKPITDRVTLKRMNTFEISEDQKKIVETVFDFIYKNIK